MAQRFHSVLIDTNAYSQIWRHHQGVLDVLAASDRLIMSVVVLGELRAGFENGTQKQNNEKILENYLTHSTVSVLPVHDSTTRIYAKLYAHQRKLGKPIPSNDLWIASQAIELDVPLLTLDAHFVDIKGLKLAL